MRYGETAEFVYDTLVLPKVTKEVVTESNGSTRTSYETTDGVKVGESFPVYCLLWNDGEDGVENVQIQVDGAVVAEKLMAVNGGSWRVIEMHVSIDTVGEHTISMGSLSKTITVSE